jgi:hypothetical protein
MMCLGLIVAPSSLYQRYSDGFGDTTQPFVMLWGEFRLAVQSSDMISASFAARVR